MLGIVFAILNQLRTILRDFQSSEKKRLDDENKSLKESLLLATGTFKDAESRHDATIKDIKDRHDRQIAELNRRFDAQDRDRASANERLYQETRQLQDQLMREREEHNRRFLDVTTRAMDQTDRVLESVGFVGMADLTPAVLAGEATRGRILVVEDSRYLRDPLMTIFRRQGFDVVGVDNLADGLKEIDREPAGAYIDLAIIGGSGLDIVRRKVERNLKTRVVVCTGTPDSADALAAGALGVTVMGKPWHIPTLIRELAGEVIAEVDGKPPIPAPETA